MALGPMKHKMTRANGITDGIFPPELGGEGILLPERPVFVFYVHCKHGRVVAHLCVVCVCVCVCVYVCVGMMCVCVL